MDWADIDIIITLLGAIGAIGLISVMQEDKNNK